MKKALVIVGSDRRATAYGILELSRKMGVSAWEWWADVQPAKRQTISLDIETKTYGSPSVKYRGLFLNDEDWGLQPWAAKTFEPETGDIGPKTYAKIFELMLRLRANTIWPAMHGCTKAFYTIDGNAQAADDYAIVVGTSHCRADAVQYQCRVGTTIPWANGATTTTQNLSEIYSRPAQKQPLTSKVFTPLGCAVSTILR